MVNVLLFLFLFIGVFSSIRSVVVVVDADTTNDDEGDTSDGDDTSDDTTDATSTAGTHGEVLSVVVGFRSLLNLTTVAGDASSRNLDVRDLVGVGEGIDRGEGSEDGVVISFVAGGDEGASDRVADGGRGDGDVNLGEAESGGDVDLESFVESGTGLSLGHAEGSGTLDTTVEVEVVDADPPGTDAVVNGSSVTIEDVVALLGGGSAVAMMKREMTPVLVGMLGHSLKQVKGSSVTSLHTPMEPQESPTVCSVPRVPALMNPLQEKQSPAGIRPLRT